MLQILKKLIYVIFWIISLPIRICLFPFKLVMRLFTKKPAVEPLEESTDIIESPAFDEEFTPEPNPVSHLGNVLPQETKYELGIYTITNPEGEIYSINTALPGAFYGETWAKVLHCYQNQKTLRARLVKPLFNRFGKRTGFSVKIGNLKTFLPNPYSLRWQDNEHPVNVCIMVNDIDPIRKKVTVNAKAAYQRLFQRHANPESGKESSFLYWDYDDDYIYVLLPGEIMGLSPRNNLDINHIDKHMGTVGKCRVELINPDKKEAMITILSEVVQPELCF